jgi:beta-lactam-binding protein with PASTA domain
MYNARLRPFLESEKTRKRFFIAGSFSAGCLSFVLFIDIIIMPIYLQEGMEIQVPDFTNKSFDEAGSIARAHHIFLITDGREYSDGVQTDRIASQRPLPETLVKPGRRVHIIISLGPQVLKVPDVVGKSPRDAELELIEAGLTVTEKRYRQSRRYLTGVVVDQRPKAQTEVQARTGVILFIAK